MNRLRVFIVDDSSVSAAAIRMAIGKDPLMEAVGTAPDAREALQRCHTLKPDVITLDLNMPGGGGLEMLSDIKLACQTPVVIVSASTYEGSPAAGEAFARGADACFDKRLVLTDVDVFLTVLRLVARPIDR